MAQPNNTPDREFSKFVDSPARPDQSSVEVVSVGKLTPPPEADTITRQVLGAQEIFRYWIGGDTGTLIKTIVITYTGTNLKDLVKVEVV